MQAVNRPLTTRVLSRLEREGIAVDGLHSKSWENLPQVWMWSSPCARNAAGETCPAYLGPGRERTGVADDPAHATGTDEEIEVSAFTNAYRILRHCIEAFIALPWRSLSMTEHS